MENRKLTIHIFILPSLVCGLMVILHMNNWDDPDTFRLISGINYIDALKGILLSPFAQRPDSH